MPHYWLFKGDTTDILLGSDYFIATMSVLERKTPF